MDYEITMEMQRICTGEKRELTRGQIAGETLDIKALTKGLKPESIANCEAFYEKLKADGAKKLYDVDSLMEETESIKAEFEQFMKLHKADDIFVRLYDDIGNFFRNPPFEGLENIEYGIHEVCVFSILEYFTWKTLPSHDHEACRAEYRDSIASRTFDEVADKWIGVCDDLQRRYEAMAGDMSDSYGMKLKLMGCCVVAVTAISSQDSFVLDAAASGAGAKAKEIVDAREADSFKGGAALDENAVRLSDFVYGHIKENQELAS